MKFVLRTTPHLPGGLAHALFDEWGEMLPMQRGVEVKHVVGEVSTVTVTFIVDGKSIVIAESK